MVSYKPLFYDWMGLNTWLFRQINGIHGKTYDSVMLLLTRAAEHRNFPYYLAALLAYVLISLTVRKLRNKAGIRQYAAAWIGVFAVLIVGFGVTAGVVKGGKAYFGYPRPYIALEHVHVIGYQPGKEDDHHSFPSGHAAFATLMVMGLWPVIPEGLGWVGLLFIAGVAWSRIALGMHFPADVLASFLIMTPLIVMLRAILYPILARMGWKC